jgi:hypothetical protein
VKPSVLTYGLASFLTCLAVHVLVWRLRRPRRQVLALAVVFWAAPVAAWSACGLLGMCAAPGWDAVASALLHFALTCAYIQTYPAISDLSPSLLIMPLVARPEGASFEQILGQLNRPMLLEERIHYLIRARLVRPASDGRLELTVRSRALVALFVAMRRVLGMPAGQG